AGRRSNGARSGRPSSPSPRRGWRRQRTHAAGDPRSALRTARPSRSPGWWDYPCRRYAGRRRARVSGDGRRRGPRPPRPAVRANASWRNLSHARLTTNQRSPSMTLMSALSPAIGPDTAVVSLQNGVDNEEKIDAVLGRSHAVGGAAYVFAGIEAPGVIAHRFGGRIVFGELDGRTTPRCERLRDALGAAS